MTTAVLKDAALEEYYESLFMMFGSRGWQKLMEDVGHIAKTSDSLTGVETVEQLWFRKGQIDQILWLTNSAMRVSARTARSSRSRRPRRRPSPLAAAPRWLTRHAATDE
jgi:hypothetical protein